MSKEFNLEEIIHLTCNIRRNSLKMISCSQSSHIGSNLSVVDILVHLYNYWLHVDPKNPTWENRDRLIFSKGHAAASLYATLSAVGFFPKEWINNYCTNGSKLYGHVSHQDVPGIEFSTGSLGHGLAIGVGMALVLKREQNPARVVVILSDGECDEGSIWEASLLASHLKLENLTVIIDYNKIQALGHVKDVLNLEPFQKKWESFGWAVEEMDGHDHKSIYKTLKKIPFKKNKPSCVIAHTLKGKGVSFMENQLLWHYKSPDENQLKLALQEIDEYEKRLLD